MDSSEHFCSIARAYRPNGLPVMWLHEFEYTNHDKFGFCLICRRCGVVKLLADSR